MRVLVAAIALAAGVAALPGCTLFSYGQFDPLSSGRAFDDAQRRFNRLVRWGQWEKAAELVASDQRQAFLDLGRVIADVRFTDWDVTVLEMGENFETAHLEVRIEGYRPTTLTQHEVVMVQAWERLDGVSSTWVVRPRLEELRLAFAGR